MRELKCICSLHGTHEPPAAPKCTCPPSCRFVIGQLCSCIALMVGKCTLSVSDRFQLKVRALPNKRAHIACTHIDSQLHNHMQTLRSISVKTGGCGRCLPDNCSLTLARVAPPWQRDCECIRRLPHRLASVRRQSLVQTIRLSHIYVPQRRTKNVKYAGP
jgi:hypothetical protein